ncbi:MAG TPA: hypothetical protein VIM96_09305 [Pseudomonadales bacterium]
MPNVLCFPVNTVVARLVRDELHAVANQCQVLVEGVLKDALVAPDVLAEIDRHLDQLRGAMAILQLQGAEALVASLRQACALLPTREGRARKYLAGDISEGLVALPLFFDHALKTGRDIPSLLLPSINVVRAQAGLSVFPDSRFQSLDWQGVQLPAATGQADPADLLMDLPRLRHMFSTGLLGLLQQRYQRISLKLMHRAATQLHKLLGDSPAGQRWELAAVLLGACVTMNTENTIARKRLWMALEKDLRQLGHSFDAASQKADPEWQHEALFVLALSGSQDSDARRLLTAANAPVDAEWTEQRLSQERHRMFGKTTDTLDSMARELRLEMGQAKRVVEYMVTAAVTPKAVVTLASRLKKIADAVRLAGLAESYDLLVDMLHTLKRWHDGSEVASRDLVLSMADSLLFVESRFAEIDGLNPMYTAPAQTDQLFMVSRRQLLDAQRIVIRECLHNLGHIKSVIGIYIDNAFDEKQLDTLGVFANQVRGGLVLLELARPAAIVGAATHFINKLSHEKVAAGDLPRMMEALADVLITIEHYLEEYEVSKKGDESLLLIAEKSLETLGYTGVSS